MKFRSSFILVFFVVGCGRKAPPPGKPDVDGPVLVIKGLAVGDTLRDSVQVEVEAEDKSKIAFVSLFVDGTEKMRDSTSPYVFQIDTAQFPDTLHTVQAKAIDVWDNWGESSKITVFSKNGNVGGKKGQQDGE